MKNAISQHIQQAWNEIGGILKDVGSDISDIKKKVNENIDDLKENFFTARCDDWVKGERENPPDFSDLPPPPCTLNQARNDENFLADSACNEGKGCGLHAPDAYHCVRSRRPR